MCTQLLCTCMAQTSVSVGRMTVLACLLVSKDRIDLCMRLWVMWLVIVTVDVLSDTDTTGPGLNSPFSQAPAKRYAFSFNADSNQELSISSKPELACSKQFFAWSWQESCKS